MIDALRLFCDRHESAWRGWKAGLRSILMDEITDDTTGGFRLVELVTGAGQPTVSFRRKPVRCPAPAIRNAASCPDRTNRAPISI